MDTTNKTTAALADVRWTLEARRAGATPDQRQLINSAIKHINAALDAINQSQIETGR